MPTSGDPAVRAAAAVRVAAAAWAADDPDPNTRAEVEGLLAAGDDAGLAERFGTHLEFGTAGLRGKLGAGPNRMNRALVMRAAAGLAQHLRSVGLTGSGVVIGYDARHLSAQFAADTAAVMAGFGLRAFLFPKPVPTPVLAYAIGHLGADAGVMVTASHNPAEYNGYKVYMGDGAQIIPPTDRRIADRIAAISSLSQVSLAPPDHPLIRYLGNDVVDAYLCDAVAQSLDPAARDVRIVYTPMHGVGGAFTTRLLRLAGFTQVDVVQHQFEPDPDFPTVSFPNPEEPGALDLALDLARARRADLVLANDPDADRLGAAVPSDDGWRALTGDEIGWLLADHILSHGGGDDRVVATSIVSSTLLAKMAAAAGVHFVPTLTGFKWLARAADGQPGWRLVFGYEEALGYSVGTMVRDKDGITAALLLAEVVARLKASGRRVQDRLDDFAVTFGAHVTGQWSSSLGGPDGPARIQAVVHRLRAAPPRELDAMAVTSVIDLLLGGEGLPPTDGVVLHLGDRARIIVRPSGTEPKVKVYFEVVSLVGGTDVASARAGGWATIARLRQAMATVTGLPA